jgi:hypothetical protein
MGSYLILLDRYHANGEMAEEQNRRYYALRGCLRTALPLIERLNLYRPPVALE